MIKKLFNSKMWSNPTFGISVPCFGKKRLAVKKLGSIFKINIKMHLKTPPFFLIYFYTYSSFYFASIAHFLFSNFCDEYFMT